VTVKIDHPRRDRKGRKGRKDVADALAGMVHSITEREFGAPIDMAQGSGDRETGPASPPVQRVQPAPKIPLPFIRR